MGRNTEGIRQMREFQADRGTTEVGDHSESVETDGDRWVGTDQVRGVDDRVGDGAAGGIRAMGHPQISIGEIIMGDQAKSIGARGNGVVVPNVTYSIEGRYGCGAA